MIILGFKDDQHNEWLETYIEREETKYEEKINRLWKVKTTFKSYFNILSSVSRAVIESVWVFLLTVYISDFYFISFCTFFFTCYTYMSAFVVHVII